MERGYLGDRFAWTSLAWNGLNGLAEFPHVEATADRFEENFTMQPWKTGGDYVLIMGQVPGDQSLRGMDLMPWYGQVAMNAQTAYEMPVMFRQHPLSLPRGRQRPRYTQPSVGSLQEALDGAAVVVTFNSNSAVDAVVAGVPSVALDRGSMAWDVSAHRLGDIRRPDREAWAHRLAWRQWIIGEIEDGTALNHVLKKEIA